MIATLLQIGVGLLLLYLAVLLLMFFAQTSLIFPASRHLYRTPAANGCPYDDVYLTVDGCRTHLWYIPADDPRAVILFSHGNAGNMADRIETALLFRLLRLDVVLYDYGGYGNSTGRPSEARCYADARAVWRYLTQDRRIPPERIILAGRSLGAAVAAQLATEVTPAALILESTFLSTADMAREAFPFILIPTPFFLRHRFDTAAKIHTVPCPILIIHSPDDTIVPWRHGRRLFDLAPEPKQFLEIRGDHNEGFFNSRDAYLAGIDAFLSPVLSR